MDVEQVRGFLKTLPLVHETLQWGEKLVFWVGEKTQGGKMFAIADLGGPTRTSVLAFYAGQPRAAELVEQEGVVPAPYLARAHWVALTSWDTLPWRELKPLLTAAHAGILARLPQRVRTPLH